LAGAAFDVLGVLLEAYVGVALYVGGEAGPLHLVDQVDDPPAELGRGLDFVLRLAECGRRDAHAVTASVSSKVSFPPIFLLVSGWVNNFN